MNKLSLKTKLGVGFGTLLALLLVLGLFSYRGISNLGALSNGVDEGVQMKELALTMENDMNQSMSSVEGFLFTGRENLLAGDEDAKRELHEGAAKIDPKLHTPEARRLFATVQEANTRLRDRLDREIASRKAGKRGKFIDSGLAAQAATEYDAMHQAIREFETFQDRKKEEGIRERNAFARQTELLILVLSLTALAVGILVAVVIVRSIQRSVAGMVSIIEQVAENNLAADDLPVRSRDEIGRAGEALNRMKNNLHNMIESMANSAVHVASASEEISASASQSAQAADLQLEQSTQVATAMQEMSSTVYQVSQNSSRAAEAAEKASSTARQGGVVVEDTLRRMREIAESVSATARKMEDLGRSSDQIGRIVGVINDIADQTNLLALNAAIEAARAGEQGRGFAVVADEVRKLAERTTSATKEIADMIKNIQSEIRVAVSAMETGTRQVGEGLIATSQAGNSLRDIISMAEQVREMITQIATAATEQSSATEQVNASMERISRLVRESAAGAQQSAQACQELSNLGLDLQGMVERFQLRNSRRNPAARSLHDQPRAAEPRASAASAR